MEKKITELTIQHFRLLLASETDRSKREILRRLLAEEQAKLHQIEHTTRGNRA